MNDMNFVDKVKKYFGYLESGYDFKISIANDSIIRPQTDGVVEYTSNNLAIVIDSETGSAALWFYRPRDGKSYDIDPIAIHEYFSTTNEEKDLLLSTNPKDQHTAIDLFNQKFLLNQAGWKKEDITQDKLTSRLANYADWLKTHENLCLKGDLSWWPKLYEYKVNRARAEHLRRGKDEIGYARVKDSDGNWKLIRQSIFKDRLDHVERLKKEFSI